jgi:hypothetical protein
MTMPESVIQSKAWRSLAVGSDTASTLLAVDFDATARREARFSDLVQGLGGDLTVLETVPDPAASTAADMIEQWVRPHEEARTQVRAVLGYCAGGVYAASLVERVARWQADAPALLLFDPEISEPRSFFWQFYKTVGSLSETLSEQEIAAARHTAQEACERTADLETLAKELTGLIRDIGDPALARTGLGPARREELFTLFGSFLRYLALASKIDPLDQWRHAVAFSSTSPMNGMRAMRANGRFVEVAREVETDVEHDGLLADQKVAAAVRQLLDGQGPGLGAQERG